MIFDGFGQRAEVEFDILELTPADNQTVSKTIADTKLNLNKEFPFDGYESFLLAIWMPLLSKGQISKKVEKQDLPTMTEMLNR